MRAATLPLLRHALCAPSRHARQLRHKSMLIPSHTLRFTPNRTLFRSFAGSASSPKPKDTISKRQTGKEKENANRRQHGQHVPRRRLNRATGKVEEQRSDGSFVSIASKPTESRQYARRSQESQSQNQSHKRGPPRSGATPGIREHRQPTSDSGKGRSGSLRWKQGQRQRQRQNESQRSVRATRGVLKAQGKGLPPVFDAVEPLEAGAETESDDLLLDDLNDLEDLDNEAEAYHRLNRATGNIELVDSQGEIIIQNLDILEDPDDAPTTAPAQPRSSKSKKRVERERVMEDKLEKPKPKPKKKRAVKVQRGPVVLPTSLTVRELSLSSGINAYSLIKKVAEIGGLDMDPNGGQGSGLTRVKGKLDPYLLAQFRAEAEGGRRRLASKQVSAVAQSLLLSAEIAELLMLEFGLETELQKDKVADEVRTVVESGVGMEERPPMVTIMGHVDHGKTTLMDTLRNASVAAGEEGGITQKVAAFSFGLGDGNLPATFVDTPGHEAFASMRRCGALVTDIIVLVIAATDGVRPQTIESIELAKAGNIPLIIALTKVDMDGIDPEEAKMRVSNELATYGVETEVIGGEVQMVPLAAPKGVGIESLVEAITLQAEIMELRADTKARGEAVVLESFLDPSLGPVADVIVRWGTLKAGDIVVVGEEHAKVRQLLSTVDSSQLRAATPAVPVRVLGLNSCVRPGLDLLAVHDNKRAKQVVSLRTRRRVAAEAIADSDREASVEHESGLDDEEGESEEQVIKDDPIVYKIVLKADTDGGLEALKYSIEALNHKVTELISTEIEQGKSLTLPEGSGFVIVREGIGPVSKQDLEIASSFGAAVYGFNVRAPRNIVSVAAGEGVELVNKGVIYHLLEDIEAALYKSGAPKTVERVVGKAEVLQTFLMNPEKRGDSEWTVAGCRISEGEVSVSNRVRVTRLGEVIHSSSGIDSLKHYKRKVKSLGKGQECGISLSGFQEFLNGDVIEFYVLEPAS